MDRTGLALLEFDSERNQFKKGKSLRDGLSAVVQVGDTLWVANDETVTLERLSQQKATDSGLFQYGNHHQFDLNEYIRLPALSGTNIQYNVEEDEKADQEIDIEGLDYQDGYLWLVGSHSLVRRKPKNHQSDEEGVHRLKRVKRDSNRFLLARIPLDPESFHLKKELNKAGKNLTAAKLPGDEREDDLTHALREDEHLGNFLDIPSKENGLDIEGLAISGDRVFLGLRGPVLCDYAIILELKVREESQDTLKLKHIDSRNQPYLKHFVSLGGLGIRELCVYGQDLLILAGPTMHMDGPVVIYRWFGGALPHDDGCLVEIEALQKILDVPFQTGKDHAEGITLFSPDGDGSHSLLIVYDSASESRFRGTSAVEADIFKLPG